jgi:hypothetical protein
VKNARTLLASFIGSRHDNNKRAQIQALAADPMSFDRQLHALSDRQLQEYSLREHAWSQFEYRAELARRFALTFDADHLIVFDDVAMVTGESERQLSLSAIQGCDRSLLPALWLAIGFEFGATVPVYAPPNSSLFELKLKRNYNVRFPFAFSSIVARTSLRSTYDPSTNTLISA